MIIEPTYPEIRATVPDLSDADKAAEFMAGQVEIIEHAATAPRDEAISSLGATAMRFIALKGQKVTREMLDGVDRCADILTGEAYHGRQLPGLQVSLLASFGDICLQYADENPHDPNNVGVLTAARDHYIAATGKIVALRGRGNPPQSLDEMAAQYLSNVTRINARIGYADQGTLETKPPTAGWRSALRSSWLGSAATRLRRGRQV